MYKDRGSSEHQKVAYYTGNNLRLLIDSVATAVKAMCQYCGTVTVCDWDFHCHYISVHCYQYVR